MIKTKLKSKKEKGSTLIICLVVMFFLGALGVLNFNSSKNDIDISNNINIRNLTNQAAENGIKIAIEELFTNENNTDKIFQLSSDDSFTYCTADGTIKDESCNDYYMDTNKTIKSSAVVTLNNTTECLAYGNSDKKPYCFIIKGIGSIPVLKTEPSKHIQEVQVNTININNNGIYEL